MPLVLVALLLCMASPAFPQEAPRTDSDPEEIHFQNGELDLAALWFAPPGDGPFPAAVVIRGSGPSTRDSYWGRAFVDVMLDAGVAVLLPDKRGSDGSEGDWRNADFEELAGDALAAVHFVRSRPEVRADAVGLLGLSQGGKIAPIAAAQSHDVAFVIGVVGAATSLNEQVSWEMFHTFREAGLEGRALQEALILQVSAEKYVAGEIPWEKYRAVLDEGLASPWAPVAEGFPATPDSWRWDFFRGIGRFDPLPWWRQVEQPVLVVYGENDRNAPAVRSAYRLTRAFMEEEHPDWTVRVFPDLGHPLFDPDSPDPHRPRLAPGVVELLSEWVRGRTER